MTEMEVLFTDWRDKAAATLNALEPGCKPKSVIAELGGGLLTHYAGKSLIGNYDVYQHLMDYWATTMQICFSGEFLFVRELFFTVANSMCAAYPKSTHADAYFSLYRNAKTCR